VKKEIGLPSEIKNPNLFLISLRQYQGPQMTGDQSRLLKPLDRVCWGETTTDLGTVIETDWAGVSINWDNGHTTSIQHNDMAQVERVTVKA
jgi:hypothetical protein